VAQLALQRHTVLKVKRREGWEVEGGEVEVEAEGEQVNLLSLPFALLFFCVGENPNKITKPDLVS